MLLNKPIQRTHCARLKKMDTNVLVENKYGGVAMKDYRTVDTQKSFERKR
jgi:hypothetical protein